MLFDHILNAGPVAILLLVVSVLVFALLVDRLWVQLRYPILKQKEFSQYRQILRLQGCSKAEAYLAGLPANAKVSRFSTESHGWKAATLVLLRNRQLENDLRQQISIEWLEGERRYLNTRLRLVGLMGAIAPLLGLLGTVFGIIEMFKAIAHSTGPVTPALLAEGMWTAMVTTALGLVIAIPALAASHGLEQLSQARLQTIQDVLNKTNLVLLGKHVGGLSDEAVKPSQPQENAEEQDDVASFSMVSPA